MRLVSNDRLFVIYSRSPKRFGSFSLFETVFIELFENCNQNFDEVWPNSSRKFSNVQNFPDFKAVEQSMFKYLSLEANLRIQAQLVLKWQAVKLSNC